MSRQNKRFRNNTYKNSARRKKEIRAGILFASPAIIGFVVFILGPMIVSLFLSFTDYAVVNKTQFIGLKNYGNLFNGDNPFFYKSLFVTIYYVVLSVPIGVAFHLMMALLLNKDIKGRSIFRAIYYIPSVIPVAGSCVIWMWLLNPERGLINYLLKQFHLPTGTWLAAEETVVPSIVLIAIWMAGSTMMVFLAGLQDVPKTLYEAIDVDGGNSFHKFYHVTLPMITPTIFFNVIMGVIGGFQVFVQPLMMTEGGPNNASYFYSLLVFEEGFEYSRMGSACAMAWVLFIIVMVITVILFKSSRKWVYYEGR